MDRQEEQRREGELRGRVRAKKQDGNVKEMYQGEAKRDGSERPARHTRKGMAVRKMEARRRSEDDDGSVREAVMWKERTEGAGVLGRAGGTCLQCGSLGAGGGAEGAGGARVRRCH